LRHEREFPKIFYDMKKILLLLFFSSIVFTCELLAQPTFRFSPEQVVVDENDPVCLDVLTKDFTDLIEISFTIQWDAGVLDFNGISNINPAVTGFDISDFNVSMASQGIITFHWSTAMPCNMNPSGVTLPANQEPHKLFEICFVATGVYGKHTPVVITDSPKDMIVKRTSSNCNDIGEVIKNGFISIGTPPLTMNISSGDGFTGDVVCLDFKVKDFDNIVSFQYAVFWDETILEFNDAMTMNLTGNYFTGETQVDSGILNLLFYTTNLSTGVTLPDGTQILQLCFNVIGQCGQSSSVYIDSNPPEPIEVINAVTSNPMSGVNIGLLQQMGEVTVNCFNPDGITLDIDDKNVCPGETFTVDVKVSDFTNISKMMFNLKWNPGVINLTNITYPQSAPCTPFSGAVNQSQTSQGILAMDWTSFGLGCTLNDNFVLMRLHFSVVGPGSSNSTIAVVNPILVDKFGGQVVDVGINNNNGLVSVCQLANPTIIASSTNGNPGDQVCIDFSVLDFEDITKMQYTITWEPNVLQFVNVTNFNLTNLTSANFMTTQALSLGVLGVEWENGTGVSKPDGSNIFQVCFKIIGNPDDCSSISFEEIPWPIDVKTTTSNNTNVGLNGQPGQVCVENPFIFELSFPDVFSGPGSTVCLDVKAKNFIQLTRTQYAINWNPNILEYQNIQPTGNLPNFSAASYDESSSYTDNGQLIVNWNSANQVQGTTVADGTSIFQICFKVVGFSTQCSQVDVSDFPIAIIVNSAPTGNANLTLNSDAGSVCVSSTLNLVDAIVIPVECPTAPTGMIDITVSGGSGNFQYQWSGPGVNPSAQDQSNLGAGNFSVTVTDSQNPTLKLTQDFQVGYSANATVAHAGVDTSFACADFPFITLNGTGSIAPAGGNVTYLWQSISGSGIIVQGQGTLTPKAVGGNCWRLTVTNNISGCVDIDTVCVSSPQYPVPEAGDSRTITCSQDTVILDGSLSPFGFSNTWTAGPGGHVVPGTENFLTPKVTASGWYYLTQTSPQSGCQGVDSVFVDLDIMEPQADAGSPASLGCNDVSVSIGGQNSSTGSQFVYEWTGADICGNHDQAQTTVCGPGMYQLIVTDTLNGCTAMSEVEITADTLKPIAMIGASATTLTCTMNQITLNGAGSSSGINYTYNWTGGTLVSGQGTLQPVVNTPGTYQLEVTDTSNGCKAFSTVVIQQNKQEPVAVATVSNPINCNLAQSTLSTTGSSSGPTFSYQWLDGSGNQVGTGMTFVASTPGNYMLVVTNSQNGCTKSASASVADNTIPPTVNAGLDTNITCIGNPTLQGTTGTNPNLILNWAGPGLGCITGNGTLTPTVSCPGTYTLTVQDTVTGCINTDQVIVGNDQVPPTINAGVDTTLTCAVDEIVLQGTSNVNNIQASWSSIPANLPIVNPGSLTPTISQPGTYTLTVVSNLNGCSKTDIMVVGSNLAKPIANAGVNDSTDCVNLTGTLSAEASTLTNTILTWSAIFGSINPGDENEVNIEVGPGTYELIIVNNGNGCEARDTVLVVDDSNLPNILTDAEVEIGCNDTSVQLDASGSETGAGITYTWTNPAGAIIGSGLTVDVTEQGTYTFTVANSGNNCVNSAAVEVVQSANGPAAEAMVDHDPCDAEAMLLGNLPDGATGVWTSSTGATFDDPTAATALASGLQAGNNEFTWTLSLGNCLNYSSATATLNLDQAAPNAVNDNVTLSPDLGGTLTHNVLNNDIFGNVSFQLVPKPGLIGKVSTGATGEIIFIKEKCFVGKVEVPYVICDASCPDLCDTALLIINVEADLTEDCDDVPNGITPNGDGVNDELIFDILLNNPPDEFPDNEIIIFNRWGDIVYQAKPYNNDWRGTNQKGKELPQGTYYYILRLSIANGDIIRGDVTILK
jgi:large repetitive protein